MKRYIYGFGVFFITQLLMSCNSCGCKKGVNVNQHFDINEMKIGFITQSNFNYYDQNYDTSTHGIQFLEDSIEISGEDVRLLVYFGVNYIAAEKSTHFELINSAYACSPALIGQSGSLESIDSFYIVPVSGKFGVDTFYTDTLYTISNFSRTNYVLNDTIISLLTQNNYKFNFNSISYLVERPILYFGLRPSSNFIQFKTTNFEQLRVVLKLKNGERYEKVTKHIKLI